MPRNVNLLRIFVSSPKDITDERELLKKIVDEMNKSWNHYVGIMLELVKWETDSYPDIDNSPQDVINKQINTDYDIFIGILWKRFGTPTNNANSGTEEEFNKAYEKYLESPDDISILFYFKDKPIQPSKVDSAQLDKVMNFKKTLGEKGTLYWLYKDLKEFEQLVRVHLSKHVQQWRSRIDYEKPQDKQKENEENQLSEDDDFETEEYGLLDLLEIREEKQNNFQDTMSRMVEIINELTIKMNKRTEDLKAVKKLKDLNIIKKTGIIINQTVSHLNHFNLRMKTEIPIYSQSFTELIELLSNMLIIQDDFDNETENKQEQLNNTLSMMKANNYAKSQVVLFRKAIESWPRVSAKLNKSKRETIYVLNSLVEEMEKSEKLINELVKALEIES